MIPTGTGFLIYVPPKVAAWELWLLFAEKGALLPKFTQLPCFNLNVKSSRSESARGTHVRGVRAAVRAGWGGQGGEPRCGLGPAVRFLVHLPQS